MSNQYATFALSLADSALILGQRNAEWCGHGPVLEQDIAITNITLDLIGQSRLWYQYTAAWMQRNGKPDTTEDTLAYLRDEREFKNLLLCELPKGDWAQTILRQFFFSQFQKLLFENIVNIGDRELSAIAIKSLKEVNYHIKWSGEWVIRLGDGTEESRRRMENAITELWPYTGEMFTSEAYEPLDMKLLQGEWMQKMKMVFDEAGLTIPENVFMQTGGKKGIHTEHFGYMLSEMQYLQRAYPGAEW